MKHIKNKINKQTRRKSLLSKHSCCVIRNQKSEIYLILTIWSIGTQHIEHTKVKLKKLPTFYNNFLEELSVLSHTKKIRV